MSSSSVSNVKATKGKNKPTKRSSKGKKSKSVEAPKDGAAAQTDTQLAAAAAGADTTSSKNQEPWTGIPTHLVLDAVNALTRYMCVSIFASSSAVTRTFGL